MKGPVDVSQALLAADVPHELVRLPRRIATAEELPAVLGQPARGCVVVRLYDTDEGRFAVATPAGTRIDPRALARATGARDVRLTPATATSLVTDFTASLVPPVCLPDDLPLLADAGLGTEEILYAATGDGGNALKIRSRDLLRISGARVDAVTVPARVGLPGARPPVYEVAPHTGVPALGRAAPPY